MFWPSRPLTRQKFSHSMQRQNSRPGDRQEILVMLEYISLFCNGNETADVDSNSFMIMVVMMIMMMMMMMMIDLKHGSLPIFI